MYEVYRRWRAPVTFLTSGYSLDEAFRSIQETFDAQDHGSLSIVRSMSEPPVSLVNPKSLMSYVAHANSAWKLGGQGNMRVHALRAFPEGFAAMLCKRRRPRSVRLITYAHGEEVLIAQASRQLTLMARWVYASSDLIIVNSENTRRLVVGLCPAVAERIVRISPGVNFNAFQLPAEDINAQRESWGWPQETVVVCTVARMEERKNQQAVVRAIAESRNAGLPVAYVCAGGGEERARLTALAGQLGITDFVQFPGVVSEQAKIATFAAADIHAMPSIQVGEMVEGFGIVFIEAAAAGVPSICGDSGGQREAVKQGATGFVVDGNVQSQVTETLKNLAADRNLRQRMGRQGVAWAREHDWSLVADRTWHEVTSRISQECEK